MIGRILGALYAYGMYANVQRTADIEAFRTQLEWDAMTPEQHKRVIDARLERKRAAAEQAAEQQRKRREARQTNFRDLLTFRSLMTMWVVVLLVLAMSIVNHKTETTTMKKPDAVMHRIGH
jgi:hypothetical protein